MLIEFACCVDIGTKESNDDRVLMMGSVEEDSVYTGEAPTPVAAAVCDGCGGYAGGGLAAETVLSCIASYPPEELLDAEKLSDCLEQCRQEVAHKKLVYPEFATMCTTVAGCVFDEDRTVLFHAGDSRIYRYDGYFLARMTVDHSAVQDMVDRGQITAEEALVHPNRNIITRCIGANCPSPEVYVSRSPIEPGEIYMMCSDGLWEYVSETEITQMLSSGESLPQIAAFLVDRALELGSDDNVSVCLCRRPGGSAGASDAAPFVLD